MSTINGTINHRITLGTTGAYASPLTVTAAGYIDNTAPTDAVYGPSTLAWTVANYGRIVAQTTVGAGVSLSAGGSITNGAGGLIAGNTGVDIVGGPGTVNNYGTISGAGPGLGVYLGKGGIVVNSGRITGTYGVEAQRSNATVINSGTVSGLTGAGVGLFGGGSVFNSGTIADNATAAAGVLVSQGPAVITNNLGGVISGRDGVDAINGANVTVINSGTISGVTHAAAVAGIYLAANGTIVNSSGGLITGEYGVLSQAKYAAVTVVNSGTIVGSGGIAAILGTRGINSGGGMTVVVSSGGVVRGVGADGIDVSSNVTNAGTILATGGGVSLSASGTVTNTGTVLATGTGVFLASGGTITDSGAIVGNSGTAIAFGGNANSRLVLAPGAALSGIVQGGAGANTVELDGNAGKRLVVNYNALGLVNFQTVAFGTSGYATLAVSNTSGTVPAQITQFYRTSEMIDLTAIGTNGQITNMGNGILTVTGSAGAVSLRVSGAEEFVTTSDGTSGTNLAPALGSVISGPVNRGITLTTYGSFASPLTITSTGIVAPALPFVEIAIVGTNVATIDNFGQVAGASGFATPFIAAPNGASGIFLAAGGSIANSGTITGGAGAGGVEKEHYYGGGALGGAAIRLYGGGIVSNMGLIFGGAGGPGVHGVTQSGIGAVGAAAIILGQGGNITNSGTVIGGAGGNSGGGGRVAGAGGGGIVVVQSGTIANSGTIVGGTAGAYSGAGAPIAGAAGGVGLALSSGGIVVNAGVIEGGVGGVGASPGSFGTGITLLNGTITNGSLGNSSALITGGTGISIGSSSRTESTIVNYGSIVGSGGTAVLFGAGRDLLVIEPGSSISGAIANFHVGATIDVASVQADGLTYSNGVLTLEKGATPVAQLSFAGTATAAEFHLNPDGGTGTDITFNPNIPSNQLITLDGAPQTVVGAAGDTIVGASGTAVINAIAGPETVIGGSGDATVFGGIGDSIVAGAGNNYVDGTTGSVAITAGSAGSDTIIGSAALAPGGGPDTLLGGAATVLVEGLGQGDIVNFHGQTGTAFINATARNIPVTLGGGFAAVFGGAGDSITLGTAGQLATDFEGGATISIGSAGTDSVIGSVARGSGIGATTVIGGAANAIVQGLGSGDIVNFANQTGTSAINALTGNDLVTLGAGAATVFAGAGDTVSFGTGQQYAQGLAGGVTFNIGGAGGSDTIIGSSFPVPGAGSDTLVGGSAAVLIEGLGQGDIVNFAKQSGASAINASAGNDSITMGSGAATVFAGAGDTVNLGTGNQYLETLAAPGALVQVGSAGSVTVIGSAASGAAVTIKGGAGSLLYSPGSGNTLVDLTGSTGTAVINGLGPDVSAITDTIVAGNGGTTVFGGSGNRIGVGIGASGTDQFLHSTTISGGSIGYGTNGSTANSSSAKVTVSNFAETGGNATDFIFYQNETASTNTSIVTASTQVTIGGHASTVLTLPDGTVMTLAGVAKADFNASFFKP